MWMMFQLGTGADLDVEGFGPPPTPAPCKTHQFDLFEFIWVKRCNSDARALPVMKGINA